MTKSTRIPPSALPGAGDLRGKIRQVVKKTLPSGVTTFLKRLSLLAKIMTRRTFKASIAFNNEIDQTLVIDPLWNHTLSENKDVLERISHCGTRAAMSSQEMLNIYRLVEDTRGLSGAIAEVGVFRGGSAKLIAFANDGKRQIHLFDTFSGIPEVTPGLDTIERNSLAVGLDKVRNFLEGSPGDFQFHVGYFPDTAVELPSGMEFSFVNLDMDTYRSTKNGFEFFYPRMQRGGVIICHDYYSKSCPGVKPAVDEFMADKPERIIGLWHSQIVLVKA
jgi:O-methyltransferase